MYWVNVFTRYFIIKLLNLAKMKELKIRYTVLKIQKLHETKYRYHQSGTLISKLQLLEEVELNTNVCCMFWS